MFTWPEWIGEIADDKLFQVLAGLASIVALIITVQVWWLARRIEGRISANVRLPELGSALKLDATELNRLNLSGASAHEIAAQLTECRSRLRSIGYYDAGLRRRRLVNVEISFVRLMALFGRDELVLRVSRSIYGELQEVVADIDEFTARMRFRS